MTPSALLFATGIAFVMATAASSGCSAGASGAADGGPDGGPGADGSAPQANPDGSTTVAGHEGGATLADGEAGAAGPCAGNPVFCDDYTTTALAGAYTTYHGAWSRSATGYAVTDDTAWERARSTLAGAASNFDVTIEATTLGDYGVGIVYGGSASADDGYAVLVHPAQFQGIYLKQLVPGQSDVQLATTALPAGLAGTPLTLRVVRQGTQVTVWLNGTQRLQASDDAPSLRGRLGLLLSDTDLATTDAGAPAGAVFHLLRVDSESDGSSDAGGGDGSDGSGGVTGPGVINYAVGITPDDSVDQQIATAANQPGGHFPLTTTYNYHPGPDWAGWASISLGGAAYYTIQISPSPDDVAFDASDIANNHQADFENIAKVVASFGSPGRLGQPRMGVERRRRERPWLRCRGDAVDLHHVLSKLRQGVPAVRAQRHPGLVHEPRGDAHGWAPRGFLSGRRRGRRRRHGAVPGVRRREQRLGRREQRLGMGEQLLEGDVPGRQSPARRRRRDHPLGRPEVHRDGGVRPRSIQRRHAVRVGGVCLGAGQGRGELRCRCRSPQSGSCHLVLQCPGLWPRPVRHEW